MKPIITLIIFSILSLNALAHDLNEHPEKYCAKLKDGKKIVMHQGSQLTTEATLKNGTKIKPDGTITMNDGSTMILKEGECMDKDGAVEKEKKKQK